MKNFLKNFWAQKKKNKQPKASEKITKKKDMIPNAYPEKTTKINRPGKEKNEYKSTKSENKIIDNRKLISIQLLIVSSISE